MLTVGVLPRRSRRRREQVITHTLAPTQLLVGFVGGGCGVVGGVVGCVGVVGVVVVVFVDWLIGLMDPPRVGRVINDHPQQQQQQPNHTPTPHTNTPPNIAATFVAAIKRSEASKN